MARKKRSMPKEGSADLNIMPFIDIFSMLVTFLLVSAAFVSIGIHEVQVPFFSNAPAPKGEPERGFVINVNVEKSAIKLTTRFDAPPANPEEKNYEFNDGALATFHNDLIALRQKHPDTDKVTLYADDDVIYKDLIKVLDAIKLLKESDPRITVKDEDSNQEIKLGFLYRKVVMGSVLL